MIANDDEVNDTEKKSINGDIDDEEYKNNADYARQQDWRLKKTMKEENSAQRKVFQIGK